jgi:hypothetical protein
MKMEGTGMKLRPGQSWAGQLSSRMLINCALVILGFSCGGSINVCFWKGDGNPKSGLLSISRVSGLVCQHFGKGYIIFLKGQLPSRKRAYCLTTNMISTCIKLTEYEKDICLSILCPYVWKSFVVKAARSTACAKSYRREFHDTIEFSPSAYAFAYIYGPISQWTAGGSLRLVLIGTQSKSAS